MKKTTFLLAFIFFVVLSAFSQQLTLQEKLTHLDTYFEQARQDWEVPGLAVGIVKDDSLIFSKGYGVREINQTETVNTQTLFAIASITKTFTAAAMATLVDEVKLTWDDKVKDHLPWFELYNPYVSHHFTIRDMLSHRSGLNTFSGDLLWYASTYNREEIVKRAKHLEPSYGFREKFGYSNIMFIAAGEMIESITNTTWDQYIQSTFFEPLGMKSSITSIKDLKNYENYATPHTNKDNKTIAIDYLNWDNVGPAGSILSNIEDMSKWIKLSLKKGTFSGNIIYSENRAWEMWTQHTINPISKRSKELWPTMHFKSYGLGWQLFDYHGKKVVGHNGGYDGTLSSFNIVPEENMGFIILVNKNSTLYYSLIYKILDVFLCEDFKTEKDWSQLFLSYEKENNSKLEEDKKEEKASNEASHPLKHYTAVFHCNMYGNATIKLKNNKLELKMLPSPKFHAILEPMGYNNFAIEFKEFPSLPKGTVSFNFDKEGLVKEMQIFVPNPDFDFTELKFKIKEKL